jgi:LysM repeat protein
MAYRVYISNKALDDEKRAWTMLFPIAPPRISTQMKNRNTTVQLINESEVSIVRPPGLTEITMEVTLPSQHYPFADYESGYVPISDFLGFLETLKAAKTKINKRGGMNFILTIIRTGEGVTLHSTSMKATLEEYEIIDDAENGLDTVVALTFKQYVGPEAAKLLPTTYTTVKGDTLMKIAKLFYGKTKEWKTIYDVNQNKKKKGKKVITKSSKRNLAAGINLKIPELES